MKGMYKKLLIAIAINTVIMFAITYVNTVRAEHLYFNINRVYMALLMAFPMIVVMLLVMRSMFEDRKMNLIFHGSAIGLYLLVYFLIRQQVPVGNEQFLRSMIPHHSSAILMCERSSITDPEIASLCDEIVRSQEDEITQMKEILRRY